MDIGLLGGTGIEGKGLALRFAAAGAAVFIGSRSEERAASVASQYNTILGKPLIAGSSNREMLRRCNLVFLTVPFEHAVSAVQAAAQDFRSGQILVDVTVPIAFQGGRPEFVEPEAGSNAELVAIQVPAGIETVAAFKTIPAHALADLQTELRCDVFVCGGSQSAREIVMSAARIIPSLRPIDAGALQTARILERMTLLAVHLNRRYKRKGARFIVQGIE
jgi:NADPH-dependent F420 reductase